MKKIIVLLMVVFSVLSFADGEITGKRIQVRGVSKKEIMQKEKLLQILQKLDL